MNSQYVMTTEEYQNSVAQILNNSIVGSVIQILAKAKP